MKRKPIVKTIALDRGSVRNYSEDGHLHVETSHISKAMVCPYYGREIPDCEGLGLDPEEIYQLLRDPDELEKSAESFKGKPILLKHYGTLASDDHPHDITVGSIGSQVTWNAPYLDADLNIWDDKAVVGIESKKQTELSCGYHYDADMTAGEYEGTPYDGIMRNIRGNHLALVDVGRAGSEVVVMDSNPFINNEENSMNKTLARLLALSNKAILAKKGGLAMDADIEEIQEVLEAVQPLLEQVEDKLDDVSDEVDGDDIANDDDDVKTLDEIPEDERDEWEEIPDREGYYRRKAVAEDEDIDDDKKDKKEMGMDAATVQRKINAAVKQATAQARAEAQALETAKDKVRPLVGNVMGMDSAADVYRFALKEKGVSTKGVHHTALPAMVDMLTRQGTPARTMAQDSSTTTRSPEAAKLLGNIKVTG